MRHIALTSLILGTFLNPARAQDLEPNLHRAARHVVAELGAALPGFDPVPAALQVVAARGADREAWEFVEDALKDAGYRVGGAGHGRTLALRVWAEKDAPHRRLVVETQEETPTRFVCSYADAAWVDTPGPGDILVEGSSARDPEEAMASALRKARLRVLRRVGLQEKDGERDVLAGLPTRSFIARHEEGGTALFRAYLGVTPSSRAMARLKDRADQRRTLQNLSPWIRVGVTLCLAVICALLYLRSDLRTRGYLSGRLRVLFGILFLIGTGICWRIPL